MSTALLIRHAQLVVPGETIRPGDLLVREGRIAALGSVPAAEAAGATVVEAAGRQLSPGLVDLHTHGIGRTMYGDPSSLHAAARELGRFGTTCVLPTLVPQIREGWLDRLGEFSAAIPLVRGLAVPGLHLEGPFMTVGGAACPTLPGDLTLLERILDACAGRLTVMSLSPDAPGIVPVIQRLRRANVTVFLTHTRASPEQTDAALEAGATHATHFYDVFPLPAEKEPGVRPVGAVEAILADPRASVDFIADGIHVHPTAIRSALAAKTWAGVVLITDSNIGAGLPPGAYDTPWGYRVKVAPGDAARHETKNFLAGSALTMNRGLANLLAWLKLPPSQVWAMATRNPARVVGLPTKGRLEPGADADLVLWDDDLTAARTWVAGRLVYEK